MATIHKEIEVPAPGDTVWAAVRDFGNVHKLAAGFVTDSRIDEGGAVRIVTFANGMQARERLVTRDEAARRLVYLVEGGRPSHYNACVQVAETGPDRSRLLWTVDVLPDALAPAIAQMMEQGCQAMRSALTPGAR
jgi:carbon monoxide dehydrogenase subunit G